ncbi:DUF3967 domain-containing protein [Bacillus salacetis]|uniref:DUF3967 domain-containing protein n=1 Tax=Bacillus salacetis TaxID=2315464 RepID=A0A3A1QLL6_9BACI|nr:DUF3967 domain-containing protein [Bacillus salacetis]RIW27284.1 DUF3967 domain-containing protein [Bacillus salacetis]
MDNLSTKDIAKITDIAESTVRKYAQLLEANGYIFNRNISGYRVYNKQDAKVFSEFKNVSKAESSVEETARNIASKYITKPSTDKGDVLGDTQSHQGFDHDTVADLMKKVNVLTDMNEKQMKFNEELLRRLDQQQKYLDERLEARDQTLIESLRETQETKQLLLAAREEEKSQKGFFRKLFGK